MSKVKKTPEKTQYCAESGSKRMMTARTMKWSDKQRCKKDEKTWKLNFDALERKNTRKQFESKKTEKTQYERKVTERKRNLKCQMEGQADTNV